jgi:hypothetical protein
MPTGAEARATSSLRMRSLKGTVRVSLEAI